MSLNQREPSPTLEAEPALPPAHPHVGHDPAHAPRKFYWRILHWFSPWRAWRELKLAQTARKEFAAGLALGVFIACLPIYGLQTVACLISARKLSLHPLSVVAGSQLSAPPIGPVLCAVSMILGHAILTGKIPDLTHWRSYQLPPFSLHVFDAFLLSWIIGGIILGVVLAGLTFASARIAFWLIFPKREE